MYITLSELIQLGTFIIGFAALLKSKKGWYKTIMLYFLYINIE